jgi:hypothetical protein
MLLFRHKLVGRLPPPRRGGVVVHRPSSSSSRRHRLPPPPATDVPFDDLPWNLNLPTEHTYLRLVTTPDVGWTTEHYDSRSDAGAVLSMESSYHRYSDTPLPLHPSNTSLNYGTTIWEGLACRRSPTSGKALVFRPDMNYDRFARGARAMCLPSPSYELFMRGLQAVLQNNATLIPPPPPDRRGYRIVAFRGGEIVRPADATRFRTAIGIAPES